MNWTGRIGADAVVITAAAPSSGIVNEAVAMVRRKGRVVPVGEVGLELERGPLYQREADVLISTSYGPGRYDTTYEEAGVDYPISLRPVDGEPQHGGGAAPAVHRPASGASR